LPGLLFFGLIPCVTQGIMSLFEINAKIHYGLMFLAELSNAYKGGEYVSIQSFSQKTSFVPEGYMEEIVAEFRKSGLVVGRRGASGGYRLTKEPKQITVKDAIEILDGPICIAPCEKGSCTLLKKCGFRSFWAKAQKGLEEQFASMTLEEIDF
jgi:Rrf2 family transcriptional regulator, cysteine metabolism repressor